MKYAVISSLSFKTDAQRDGLSNELKPKIANKPTWGEVGLSSDIDIDGKPHLSLSIRYDEKPDMADLFDAIKQKISLIPVLKGSVSSHICGHDEQPYDCRNDPRAEYQEFVK